MGLLIDGKWTQDEAGGTDKTGRFQRPASVLRHWITPDGAPGPSGEGGFGAQAGRYHLYVSLACPWAHRALIFRTLKGLEGMISLSVVNWFMGEEGWSFEQGAGGTSAPPGGARLVRPHDDPSGGARPVRRADGTSAPQRADASSPPHQLQISDHRGWYMPHELPHFDSPEVPQSITFRLNDSLPVAIEEARAGEGGEDYARRIDAALDGGAGACLLRRPDVAAIVIEALHHGVGKSYDLHAYVVMPNHVHVLISAYEGFTLAGIVQTWKGYSSKQINKLLGREGRLWQRNYFDRFVRNEAHFDDARAYIENNPVAAGLVKNIEDWRFGSAWERAQREYADGTSAPQMVDPIFGARFMHEVYSAAHPDYTGRVTVPVLFDRQTRRIVNNESSEIIRMFNSAFDGVGATPGDYYPADLRPEIDALNERIYATLNNGVYRSGFASTQGAYEEAVIPLFETLDMLDERLATRRYLCGARITEADWRLFPTLVRFDAVYHGHFKCNLRRIVDYPHLSGYLRDLYQTPGVAETVDFAHCKGHYYQSHKRLNPSGVVPIGPVMTLDAPHGRDAL